MNNFSKIKYISLILLPSLFSSCEGFRFKKYTPKEFLNHSVIKKENYYRDSAEILQQLKGSLKKHANFFYSKEYFDSTQLIIDTIVYSPDFKKLAAFIITKNPTDSRLMVDTRFDWYYNGTCYLGSRQKDTISLSWTGPNFSSSTNKKELSNIMRDSYFNDFATKDTVGPHTYKYNMNDVRFWDCPIWREQEIKKERKKRFEQEKKSHPENIYEPKQ